MEDNGVILKEIEELEYKILFYEGIVDDDLLDVWRDKIEGLKRKSHVK